MAHVYAATRTSAGIERRVALKVLRQRGDTAALIERFERERETLAELDHEHIVTFLDAAVLPDGRPFLAMELVEGGATIVDWCRDRDLDLGARLELFARILSAVQHAHGRLVVHRDLKPSNVLVTPRGSPKLLDFGVASLLAGPAQSTASGRQPLTYAYASPEQLAGGPVSTATDVHALGLLLGELCSDLPADADVEAIAARARAPEPAQRYASVDELAADLRRHREGLPVTARPATPGYVLGKFVRRNRWPVAVAASLMIALLAGWIGADVGRRRAQAEARLGWGAHAQAKWVAGTFEDLLLEAFEARPGERRRLIAEMDSRLAETDRLRTESEAMLRLTLARLHLELASTDADSDAADDSDGAEAAERAARAHLERVLELARTTRGLGRREVERAEALLAALDG